MAAACICLFRRWARKHDIWPIVWPGNPKRSAWGRYPEVSLSDARERLAEVKSTMDFYTQNKHAIDAAVDAAVKVFQGKA
ncbi:MAG: Arm DNA-binding domain-containing protein [Azoarcus sp.]|jgi:hypothetical protein|nr:Arm DNA-binding domain-containing protein [Azoarcus sp.]